MTSAVLASNYFLFLATVMLFSVHFFTDLLCAAIALSFCCILPSNSKKKLYAHQYRLDLVIDNLTELNIQVRSDRCQPYLLVYRSSWADVHEIVIYLDKIAVYTVPPVAAPLYIILTLQYVLNIEYSPSVFPTLQLLQIKCTRISCKADKLFNLNTVFC